ncbi:LexA repressor [Lachnospiraceae bacterium]|nr:LexA repressor [Lachnospiraceae bacterium]
MEPDYYDGDIVLVSQKAELSHGDVGIFIINNDAYIKEYGETELISRNPDADNIIISEYDNIVCMGKVVGKYVWRNVQRI